MDAAEIDKKPTCMFLIMVEPCPVPAGRTLPSCDRPWGFPGQLCPNDLPPPHCSLALCGNKNQVYSLYLKCIQSK